MKKILFLAFLSILAIGISNAQITGATDLDQSLQVNAIIASDSTITGTKYSSVITLNSNDPADINAYVNFQAGAHILVLAHQSHDSVNAIVSLQVGNNIVSGTEGKDYGTILIDSLQSTTAGGWKTTEVINIDLAKYLNYQQARIKVVAFTGYGVGLGAWLPKWSAIFGGQGKLGKITNRYKASSVIH